MERDKVGESRRGRYEQRTMTCMYENIMVTPTMLTKIVNFKRRF